eukprot:10136604-Karenia_brevis.AAC.1
MFDEWGQEQMTRDFFEYSPRSAGERFEQITSEDFVVDHRLTDSNNDQFREFIQEHRLQAILNISRNPRTWDLRRFHRGVRDIEALEECGQCSSAPQSP